MFVLESYTSEMEQRFVKRRLFLSNNVYMSKADNNY